MIRVRTCLSTFEFMCVCGCLCVCVCVDELHDNYVCISLHNKVRKASRLKYCCVSGSSDSHVKL